jgi:hypothetical protein
MTRKARRKRARTRTRFDPRDEPMPPEDDVVDWGGRLIVAEGATSAVRRTA